MQEKMPTCPISATDTAIIRPYIERQHALDKKQEILRNRPFVKRVLRSAVLQSTINNLADQQSAVREMYPEVITEDKIAAYSAWVEALADYIEQLGDDATGSTILADI